MPHCNSETMSLHLEEISNHVAPGAHAVVILDQAGWHGSAALVVPHNITLMPLPCQETISSFACSSTSTGNTAGPAEKLYTRAWLA